MFRVRIPPGYDFRAVFLTQNSRLYGQAFRSLTRASWYYETSPTHFINYIHNFNHVLWHFALIKHQLVPSSMTWQALMGQFNNPGILSRFPTMAHIFDQTRAARNTNLGSHPYADRVKKFTKMVTFQERDKLKSQLKSAYEEFVQNA